MLFKSTILGPTSGKLNGSVFSHNRVGQYMRVLRIPVNPNSSFQQDVRNALATAQADYSALSSANTSLWENFATQTQRQNAIGDAFFLTGRQAFVAGATLKLQAGLVPTSAPPTLTGFAAYTTPVMTVVAAGTTFDAAFTSGDSWTALGGAMLIYCSRPKPKTINFFKGPYRLAGVILGNTLVPPTSPATLTYPFGAIGPSLSKIFFRVRVVTPQMQIGDARTFAAIVP